MADIIRELTICTQCAHIIANGEAFDHNGVDVSETIAERQVATLGADAGIGVLTLSGDCEPSVAIGTCDACGTDPSVERGNPGYWDGAYNAAIIR